MGSEGPTGLARAEVLRLTVLELRAMRGQLAKITTEDYEAILQHLDRLADWQHRRHEWYVENIRAVENEIDAALVVQSAATDEDQDAAYKDDLNRQWLAAQPAAGEGLREALDRLVFPGNLTWHVDRRHGGDWQDCRHTTCDVFRVACRAALQPASEGSANRPAAGGGSGKPGRHEQLRNARRA
jgi:hypothetical protein